MINNDPALIAANPETPNEESEDRAAVLQEDSPAADLSPASLDMGDIGYRIAIGAIHGKLRNALPGVSDDTLKDFMISTMPFSKRAFGILDDPLDGETVWDIRLVAGKLRDNPDMTVDDALAEMAPGLINSNTKWNAPSLAGYTKEKFVKSYLSRNHLYGGENFSELVERYRQQNEELSPALDLKQTFMYGLNKAQAGIGTAFYSVGRVIDSLTGGDNTWGMKERNQTLVEEQLRQADALNYKPKYSRVRGYGEQFADFLSSGDISDAIGITAERATEQVMSLAGLAGGIALGFASGAIGGSGTGPGALLTGIAGATMSGISALSVMGEPVLEQIETYGFDSLDEEKLNWLTGVGALGAVVDTIANVIGGKMIGFGVKSGLTGAAKAEAIKNIQQRLAGGVSRAALANFGKAIGTQIVSENIQEQMQYGALKILNNEEWKPDEAFRIAVDTTLLTGIMAGPMSGVSAQLGAMKASQQISGITDLDLDLMRLGKTASISDLMDTLNRNGVDLNIDALIAGDQSTRVLGEAQQTHDYNIDPTRPSLGGTFEYSQNAKDGMGMYGFYTSPMDEAVNNSANYSKEVRARLLSNPNTYIDPVTSEVMYGYQYARAPEFDGVSTGGLTAQETDDFQALTEKINAYFDGSSGDITPTNEEFARYEELGRRAKQNQADDVNSIDTNIPPVTVRPATWMTQALENAIDRFENTTMTEGAITFPSAIAEASGVNVEQLTPTGKMAYLDLQESVNVISRALTRSNETTNPLMIQQALLALHKQALEFLIIASNRGSQRYNLRQRLNVVATELRKNNQKVREYYSQRHMNDSPLTNPDYYELYRQKSKQSFSSSLRETMYKLERGENATIAELAGALDTNQRNDDPVVALRIGEALATNRVAYDERTSVNEERSGVQSRNALQTRLNELISETQRLFNIINNTTPGTTAHSIAERIQAARDYNVVSAERWALEDRLRGEYNSRESLDTQLQAIDNDLNTYLNIATNADRQYSNDMRERAMQNYARKLDERRKVETAFDRTAYRSRPLAARPRIARSGSVISNINTATNTELFNKLSVLEDEMERFLNIADNNVPGQNFTVQERVRAWKEYNRMQREQVVINMRLGMEPTIPVPQNIRNIIANQQVEQPTSLGVMSNQEVTTNLPEGGLVSERAMPNTVLYNAANPIENSVGATIVPTLQIGELTLSQANINNMSLDRNFFNSRGFTFDGSGNVTTADGFYTISLENGYKNNVAFIVKFNPTNTTIYHRAVRSGDTFVIPPLNGGIIFEKMTNGDYNIALQTVLSAFPNIEVTQINDTPMYDSFTGQQSVQHVELGNGVIDMRVNNGEVTVTFRDFPGSTFTTTLSEQRSGIGINFNNVYDSAQYMTETMSVANNSTQVNGLINDRVYQLTKSTPTNTLYDRYTLAKFTNVVNRINRDFGTNFSLAQSHGRYNPNNDVIYTQNHVGLDLAPQDIAVQILMKLRKRHMLKFFSDDTKVAGLSRTISNFRNQLPSRLDDNRPKDAINLSLAYGRAFSRMRFDLNMAGTNRFQGHNLEETTTFNEQNGVGPFSLNPVDDIANAIYAVLEGQTTPTQPLTRQERRAAENRPAREGSALTEEQLDRLLFIDDTIFNREDDTISSNIRRIIDDHTDYVAAGSTDFTRRMRRILADNGFLLSWNLSKTWRNLGHGMLSDYGSVVFTTRNLPIAARTKWDMLKIKNKRDLHLMNDLSTKVSNQIMMEINSFRNFLQSRYGTIPQDIQRLINSIYQRLEYQWSTKQYEAFQARDVNNLSEMLAFFEGRSKKISDDNRIRVNALEEYFTERARVYDEMTGQFVKSVDQRNKAHIRDSVIKTIRYCMDQTTSFSLYKPTQLDESMYGDIKAITFFKPIADKFENDYASLTKRFEMLNNLSLNLMQTKMVLQLGLGRLRTNIDNASLNQMGHAIETFTEISGTFIDEIKRYNDSFDAVLRSTNAINDLTAFAKVANIGLNPPTMIRNFVASATSLIGSMSFTNFNNIKRAYGHDTRGFIGLMSSVLNETDSQLMGYQGGQISQKFIEFINRPHKNRGLNTFNWLREWQREFTRNVDFAAKYMSVANNIELALAKYGRPKNAADVEHIRQYVLKLAVGDNMMFNIAPGFQTWLQQKLGISVLADFLAIITNAFRIPLGMMHNVEMLMDEFNTTNDPRYKKVLARHIIQRSVGFLTIMGTIFMSASSGDELEKLIQDVNPWKMGVKVIPTGGAETSGEVYTLDTGQTATVGPISDVWQASKNPDGSFRIPMEFITDRNFLFNITNLFLGYNSYGQPLSNAGVLETARALFVPGAFKQLQKLEDAPNYDVGVRTANVFGGLVKRVNVAEAVNKRLVALNAKAERAMTSYLNSTVPGRHTENIHIVRRELDKVYSEMKVITRDYIRLVNTKQLPDHSEMAFKGLNKQFMSGYSKSRITDARIAARVKRRLEDVTSQPNWNKLTTEEQQRHIKQLKGLIE